MVAKLNSSFIVYKLAEDLGLKASDDPVRSVLNYCNRKIRAFLDDYPDCTSPGTLLDWAANRLGTRFREIHTAGDLRAVKDEYIAKSELGFANIEQEFNSGTEGITIRLQKRETWEPQFVSIIDCRGRKSQRRYHTKWHELGHLLILTDQTRLAFRRSHQSSEPKSAEESLVDTIAGDLSFYGPMVQPLLEGEISFEKIESVRAAMCPEASQYAAVLNISKLWPSACIWVEARLGYKKGEQPNGQASFAFSATPAPVLRAGRIAPNDVARELGMVMIPNFRVPTKSIIYKVFHGGLGYGEATENLSDWSSTDGSTRLSDQEVLVKVKQIGESVHALIIPKA